MEVAKQAVDRLRAGDVPADFPLQAEEAPRGFGRIFAEKNRQLCGSGVSHDCSCANGHGLDDARSARHDPPHGDNNERTAGSSGEWSSSRFSAYWRLGQQKRTLANNAHFTSFVHSLYEWPDCRRIGIGPRH